MRIFFIGNVQFSFDSLKALLDSGANIVGVASKADSNFNADYKDLKPLCEHYNIPLKIVNNINHPNNVEFIKKHTPDIIYCFGWSNLLKDEILTIAPKGVIGFHPAKIPNNKGRHPIIWALFLGLKTTASSFFFMDQSADTGDILSQIDIEITNKDDAKSLYKKITETAIKQILYFSRTLALDTNDRIVQVGTGNVWRKRGKKDGEIDFRMSSRTIYNLVRALTSPYVGAHLIYNSEEYKIWKTKISSLGSINDEPGKILASDEKVFTVKTVDGAITILEHEIEKIPLVGEYL